MYKTLMKIQNWKDKYKSKYQVKQILKRKGKRVFHDDKQLLLKILYEPQLSRGEEDHLSLGSKPTQV